MNDWKQVLHSVTPRDKVRLIVREVAEESGLSVTDIMGRELIQEVSWARSVAMWRIHTELKMGVTQIGRFFDRDHSTVHHNIRKVKESIGAETCQQA